MVLFLFRKGGNLFIFDLSQSDQGEDLTGFENL